MDVTKDEREALRAEHQPYTWNCEIEDCRCKEHLAKCRGCGDIYPCDVYRMAELKDAETAEMRERLQHKIEAVQNWERMAQEWGEIRRGLEEQRNYLAATKAQAVSEVVERIAEALDEAREDSFSRESLTSLDFWNRGQTKGLDEAIALLRSRDWSKGEG